MSAARVGELAAALHLARVGFDRQIQAVIDRPDSGGAIVGRRRPIERRSSRSRARRTG